MELADGAPNIHFAGWCGDSRLRRLIQQSIATVYLPKDEDFGLSPVESMAAGKPVIGVAEGGLNETILDGETGLLLPSNPTQQDVMDAVQRLNADTAASMRERCEQRAKNFSGQVFHQSDEKGDRLAVNLFSVNRFRSMPGPIVVGGPEEAGTDIVAALLRRFKICMGHDLSPGGVWNPAALLLDRPNMHAAFADNGLPDCHLELDMLAAAMCGEAISHPSAAQRLRECVKDYAHHPSGVRWAFQVAGKLLDESEVDEEEYRGWGFALPSSHLFLPQLADHFPRLRFIYVVRDGLTAARGGDYRQLDGWGAGLNVRRYHDASRRPHEMLKYWLRATRLVLDRARRFAPERFLRLDLEHIARQPYATTMQIVDFLGLEAEDPEVETAVKSVERALGSGPARRQRAGDEFSRRDLRQLARLRTV